MENQTNQPKSGIFAFIEKRRWWLVSGVLAIVIIAIIFLSGGTDEDKYDLTQVEFGDLVQTVEASGELEAFEKADLSFQMSGTVSQIFVDVGDQVLKDQLLAMLDSAEVLADLSAAQFSFNLAEAQLNQYIAGSTDQELEASTAALESAEADLKAKQSLAVINVDAAERSLEFAKTDLENTILDNKEDVAQVYEDLVNLLDSAVIDMRSTLSDADEILGIENITLNDDFENLLSATDPQQLTNAKYYYEYAAEYRDLAEDSVYALYEDSTQGEVDLAADYVDLALSYTADTLLYTRRVLDATTADSADFSATDNATYKTTIDAARNAVQAEQTAILTQRQLIDVTIISAKDLEDTADNTLETQQQAYDQAIVNAESSVVIAQATADSRRAELDALITKKRDVDLAVYYAQVGQAQANLDAAVARLERSEIRSPFDGVVTLMDIEVGEFVSAGLAVAGAQSNTEMFSVVVDIPEADIVKIELDDHVDVTFDAYGDDELIVGRVGNISPAENNIDGVVYYEIEIYLDDDSDLRLKSGMSADVTIITNEKEGVLYIQQRAVLENASGDRYVRIPDRNDFEEVEVEIGLRADGGLVEILSGIEQGQEVITRINE